MSRRVRFIFYKTPWKWGLKYLVNHLISLRTWSKYSHVEIWVANESILGFGYISLPVGTCYTSTMRGEENGTVERRAIKVLKHPERWDYIEFDVNDREYKDLILWLDKEVKANKGYSKWDILKFLSPIHFPDNKRNICSELCNDGACIAGIIKGRGIVSPAKLLKKLVAVGGVVKELI